MPKTSLWEVLVIKFDCQCEDHYRRQKGVEKKFCYFDCSVHCKNGKKDGCKQSFDESHALAAKASEED